jgi:hypothetical protein
MKRSSNAARGKFTPANGNSLHVILPSLRVVLGVAVDVLAEQLTEGGLGARLAAQVRGILAVGEC